VSYSNVGALTREGMQETAKLRAEARADLYRRIRKYVADNPEECCQAVADRFQVDRRTVKRAVGIE
jgi:hypothetical protein